MCVVQSIDNPIDKSTIVSTFIAHSMGLLALLLLVLLDGRAILQLLLRLLRTLSALQHSGFNSNFNYLSTRKKIGKEGQEQGGGKK